MVFHGRRKVFAVFSSRRPLIVGDWSPTSHPPVGDNRYKLEGSAKTSRRMVSDWSPMGGDLRAMVSDSRMISGDLLSTDCGPLEVRPVLDLSPTTMSVTATFCLCPWSPMVFGGRGPFWS